MELTLYHFFDNLLNLYGDKGNILSLQYRAKMRGIDLNVVNVRDVKGIDLTKADILFIGGGPDSLQSLCTEQLLSIKNEFKSAIEDGVTALTICGGYQFLGEKYVDANGKELKTLGILDFETKSEPEKERLIGNILIESDKFGRIVGYENHGGRTYHNYDSLGKVVHGFGNNDSKEKEGIFYKNLIGTYIHGPLLPKNPNITDFMLSSALERKYGKSELIHLDNSLEFKANNSVWDKYKK